MGKFPIAVRDARCAKKVSVGYAWARMLQIAKSNRSSLRRTSKSSPLHVTTTAPIARAVRAIRPRGCDFRH